MSDQKIYPTAPSSRMMPAEPSRRRQWPRELDAEVGRVCGAEPSDAERQRVYMHIEALAKPIETRRLRDLVIGAFAAAVVLLPVLAIGAVLVACALVLWGEW